MEIIMISDNKLKVMLGEDDLRQFEIKAEQLDYSNTETKRMFWDILNRAKHETGFDTDGQRVLVQLYPSKEGGCEMFVTKIGLLSQGTNECSNKPKASQERFPVRLHTKKTQTNSERFAAFSFEEIKDLIEVSKRLFSIGYIGESSAYTCDNGKYYLFLSDLEQYDFLPFNEFSFINEYGTYENAEAIKYYASEHGRTMCEFDAVGTLAKL